MEKNVKFTKIRENIIIIYRKYPILTFCSDFYNLAQKLDNFTAGTKSRSQVTSAGQTTGHCAMVNKHEHLKCHPALITIQNRILA